MVTQFNFLQKRLNNECGSLFIISTMVIIIFLGLGAALLILTTNESRVAERQRISTMAFRVAESGMHRAFYDLKRDFEDDASSPSWADGDINGYAIGPGTGSFYSLPYVSTELNGGTYQVMLKNVAGQDHIWVKSSGTYEDVTQTLQAYVKMVNLSPWGNAIFGGAGASGSMVNGNVDIRGSVHILGNGLNAGDYAIDTGGTSELVGNNYNGVATALKDRVPLLEQVDVNGEMVDTLNGELRVKKGLVGLSGSATVGEADIFGNANKETVDGVYVSDGFGGNQGASAVHADNGTSNAYDLGDAVAFPSLSDPAPDGSAMTYQQYLYANSLVISDPGELAQLASIQPNDTFSYSNANGSISMDGAGNMAVDGNVYIDGGDFNMSKQGSNKTITYTGQAAILATGNVQINVNLVTTTPSPGTTSGGVASFPTNIMGIMTPNSIGMNEAGIDVMGLFYAETSVVVEKQTDIMGTIVANYFDMGTNVPSIFQVPETVNNLPSGLIGGDEVWYLVYYWQRL